MLKYGDFIQVDGSGFANQNLYESEVIRLLTENVSRTKVGMRVLYQVKNSGFKLIIKPPANSNRLVDAQANPNNAHPIIKGSNPICAMSAASDLEYLPGDYYPSTKVFLQIEPFFGADDVLVHEIFHKARMFQGLFCVENTGDSYINLEEFFAITVTNVYLAEIGKDNRLRGGHSVLIENLKLNSSDFFIKYELRLEKLYKQMKKFCEYISTIDCAFNPIKEFVEYDKSMRGISA